MSIYNDYHECTIIRDLQVTPFSFDDVADRQGRAVTRNELAGAQSHAVAIEWNQMTLRLNRCAVLVFLGFSHDMEPYMLITGEYGHRDKTIRRRINQLARSRFMRLDVCTQHEPTCLAS